MQRTSPPRSLLAFGIGTLAVLAAATFTLAQAPKPEEVPEPFRTLIAEAPKRAAQFPEMPVGIKPGSHQTFKLRLDEKPFVVNGKDRFGCFRIKTPSEPGLDMVWVFAVPAEWAQWYILPVEGTMEGFRNWLTADRLYDEFPATTKNPAYLQTLKSRSLKPNATYVIWFKENEPTKGPVTLTAAINFLPGKKEKWDHEAIEKGLGLKDAPAAQQVEYLASRGGRILLDPRFFKPSYAKLRVDNLLTSLRHSQTFADGMFIEMRMQLPPCGTDPSLADIIAAYGQPDLVLSGEERRLFGEKEEDVETVSYYDRFGFVLGKTKTQHVYGVRTQAADMSQVKAQRDGLTWSDVPLPEVKLRIFYRDKKEIARLAFWGEPNARVLSGELPAETFRREYKDKSFEELRPSGKGTWEYRGVSKDGTPIRTATLENHAYHGVYRDTYDDGKPRSEANYKNGKLDGVLKQWSRKGEVRERSFRDGKPVEEKEQ